jgi:ribosomal protein S18 acetylase RimI-like enzyme
MDLELTIQCFERFAPSHILDEVQSIKAERHLPHPSRVAEHPGGFIVGSLTSDEIQSFLRKSGRLYVAYAGTLGVGYLLTTGIEEFYGYFSKDLNAGTSHHQESAEFRDAEENWNILDHLKNDEFIYHIATRRNQSRLQVGSQLIEHLFSDFPGRSFVADVMVEPVRNEASIGFFERCGFARIGTIDYYKYGQFGDIKTIVLRRKP